VRLIVALRIAESGIMVKVQIGGSDRQRVVISVYGWKRPADTDYWDGNWLKAGVEVKAGDFTGRVRGNLRAEEFAAFQKEVASLARTLEGHAQFVTMEEWLGIS